MSQVALYGSGRTGNFDRLRSVAGPRGIGGVLASGAHQAAGPPRWLLISVATVLALRNIHQSGDGMGGMCGPVMQGARLLSTSEPYPRMLSVLILI